MKPLKHLSDWEKGLRRSAVMAWMSWAASVGIVQAQVCIGGAGWAPTGRTTDDVRNCVGLYACYPPILEPVSYVPVGGCDPEAGACSVRAQVRATFPGNHLNQSASIPYPGSPVMMIWTTSTGGFVGSCGASGAPIWDDIGDTFITAGNFSCADPGAATGTGDYVLNVLVCQGATGCTQTDVDVPVPLTPGAMASELCPPPPPPPPTWDCGSDSCSAGCFGPGGGVGGGGSGGSSAAGGPPSLGPQGDGPGATLRYRGGGTGHPDHPKPASWNATLGRFWSHDYAEAIVEDPDATHVWLLTSSATFREFTDAGGDGDYETAVPSDEYRKLTKTAGGWELRDLDGMVKHFDAMGRWTQSVDRNGNATVATYDGGQLVGVAFPDGRSETFAYDMGGRLESITEVGVDGTTTRTWTYTWSGDDLVGIARPDGTAWEMLYDDPAHPSYMTRLTLMGTDLSERIEGAWQYDAGGNVIRTWRGAEDFTDPQAVDKWSFSFDDPALPVVTTVTDPLGNVSTYTIGRDPASDKPRLEQIDGDCPSCGMGPNTLLEYEDQTNPLRKTRETDGHGHVTLYEYDFHGQLTSRVEAFGTALERETTWEYDPTFPAFVTEIVQPSTSGDPFDERRTSFGYDAFGNQDTRTIEGVERDAAFSYVTTTTYNSAGMPEDVDPPGYGTADVTSFTYDPSRGDLLADTRTDPLIGTTAFEYDAFNRRTSVTDPNGVETETVYDDLDRVRFLIQHGADPSEDLVTEHVYDVFGDLFQTILPEGNVIEYGYDSAGRLTSIERKPDADPSSHGERTLYTLNGFGHRILEELQRWEGSWVTRSATSYEYSTRCQLDKMTAGAGSSAESVTEYDDDCNGNLERIWDANHPSAGQTAPASTEYAYDELDRLITVTQPFGGAGGGNVVTTYDYDVQDHLTEVIDGEGNVTGYVYSDRDLMTRETSEVSGITEYVYNEHGELTSQTDARGITMDRTVDELDRVTFVDYPTDSLDVTYVYDDPLVPFSLGRLTAIVRDGASVDYEYDRFGRVTRDGELAYGYDENGNRLEIGYPGDVRAITTYDYADRPSTLDVEGLGGTLMQSIVTSASYLPSGPLDSLELGNGLTETRAFDARYHPDRITVAGGSTLLDWDYLTDDVANVQAIADVLDAANDRTYDYQDYQYFLIQGDGPWGDLGWTYDTIGNRLAEVRDGQPADVYEYLENGAGGNLPQLDTIQLGGGGTRAYLYDEVGNQTQVASGANVVDFSYDDASRLAGIERTSASASTSLLYDGRSYLRNSAGSQPDTTGGGVFCDGFETGDTSAWPSGQGGCAEVGVTGPIYSSEGMLHSLDRTVNVGAGLADRYVFYFGSQPVASMELVGGSATFQYLSVDHLGTPILATESSGGSVWMGGFEPFGLDWRAGTPGGAQENSVFLRLPGQWFDETWLDSSSGATVYYNLYRWLETGTGRYTRPDPVNLGMLASAWRDENLTIDPLQAYYLAILRAGNPKLEHPFSYVAANPLLLGDPLGLFGPGALATAGEVCIAADGPLPVGDLIGFPLLIGAGVWWAATQASDWSDDDDDCDRCNLRRREIECEVQYYADIEECQRRHRPGSRLRRPCYSHASVRFALCLRGHPVPPLQP
jgi:YD repeat-containing protein